MADGPKRAQPQASQAPQSAIAQQIAQAQQVAQARASARGAKPPSELLEILAQLRWIFAGLLGFGFVTNMLLLVSPIYMMQLYDRVLLSRSETTL